jgi:hypothetical protein
LNIRPDIEDKAVPDSVVQTDSPKVAATR